MQINTTLTKFNWCAFATDYPPNVSAHTGTTYTFKGSPSFVVNNVPRSAKTYSGALNSLTDATGCPGCIGRDAAINTTIPCCLELTAVGGYCRNLAIDNAHSVTCSSVTTGSFEVARTDKTGVSYQIDSNCEPGGWRWPNNTELRCMYTARAVIGLHTNARYWSRENVGEINCNNEPRYALYMSQSTASQCSTCTAGKICGIQNSTWYLRCVR